MDDLAKAKAEWVATRDMPEYPRRCPECNSRVKIFHVSLDRALFMCGSKDDSCPWPLNDESITYWGKSNHIKYILYKELKEAKKQEEKRSRSPIQNNSEHSEQNVIPMTKESKHGEASIGNNHNDSEALTQPNEKRRKKERRSNSLNDDGGNIVPMSKEGQNAEAYIGNNDGEALTQPNEKRQKKERRSNSLNDDGGNIVMMSKEGQNAEASIGNADNEALTQPNEKRQKKERRSNSLNDDGGNIVPMSKEGQNAEAYIGKNDGEALTQPNEKRRKKERMSNSLNVEGGNIVLMPKESKNAEASIGNNDSEALTQPNEKRQKKERRSNSLDDDGGNNESVIPMSKEGKNNEATISEIYLGNFETFNTSKDEKTKRKKSKYISSKLSRDLFGEDVDEINENDSFTQDKLAKHKSNKKSGDMYGEKIQLNQSPSKTLADNLNKVFDERESEVNLIKNKETENLQCIDTRKTLPINEEETLVENLPGGVPCQQLTRDPSHLSSIKSSSNKFDVATVTSQSIQTKFHTSTNPQDDDNNSVSLQKIDSTSQERLPINSTDQILSEDLRLSSDESDFEDISSMIDDNKIKVGPELNGSAKVLTLASQKEGESLEPPDFVPPNSELWNTDLFQPPSPKTILQPPSPKTILQPPSPKTILQPSSPKTILQPPSPKTILQPSSRKPTKTQMDEVASSESTAELTFQNSTDDNSELNKQDHNSKPVATYTRKIKASKVTIPSIKLHSSSTDLFQLADQNPGSSPINPFENDPFYEADQMSKSDKNVESEFVKHLPNDEIVSDNFASQELNLQGHLRIKAKSLKVPIHVMSRDEVISVGIITRQKLRDQKQKATDNKKKNLEVSLARKRLGPETLQYLDQAIPLSGKVTPSEPAEKSSFHRSKSDNDNRLKVDDEFYKSRDENSTLKKRGIRKVEDQTQTFQKNWDSKEEEARKLKSQTFASQTIDQHREKIDFQQKVVLSEKPVDVEILDDPSLTVEQSLEIFLSQEHDNEKTFSKDFITSEVSAIDVDEIEHIDNSEQLQVSQRTDSTTNDIIQLEGQSSTNDMQLDLTNQAEDQSSTNDIIQIGLTNQVEDQSSTNDIMQLGLTNQAEDQSSTNDIMQLDLTNQVEDQSSTNDIMQLDLTNQVEARSSTNDIMQLDLTNQAEARSSTNDMMQLVEVEARSSKLSRYLSNLNGDNESNCGKDSSMMSPQGPSASTNKIDPVQSINPNTSLPRLSLKKSKGRRSKREHHQHQQKVKPNTEDIKYFLSSIVQSQKIRKESDEKLNRNETKKDDEKKETRSESKKRISSKRNSVKLAATNSSSVSIHPGSESSSSNLFAKNSKNKKAKHEKTKKNESASSGFVRPMNKKEVESRRVLKLDGRIVEVKSKPRPAKKVARTRAKPDKYCSDQDLTNNLFETGTTTSINESGDASGYDKNLKILEEFEMSKTQTPFQSFHVPSLEDLL